LSSPFGWEIPDYIPDDVASHAESDEDTTDLPTAVDLVAEVNPVVELSMVKR